MKIAAVRRGTAVHIGIVLDDESIAVLPESLGSVDDIVRGTLSLEEVAAATDRAERVALAGVSLAPPIRRFGRDILCTGWNYWEHFEESLGRREGQDPAGRPDRPAFFTKAPGTVIGPDDDIGLDESLSRQWDYEAELAVVIGRSGRSIGEPVASGFVFGYLIANDVSLRDMQRAYGGQWFKGKSIDNTMPLGPWITTAEDVADPHRLQVQCELNGEIVQDSNTSFMAFSIPEIVAELSRGMTLFAGDVILTGTPSGTGVGRNPQLFLKDGDRLVTRVSGLGELRNRVVRAD